MPTLKKKLSLCPYYFQDDTCDLRAFAHHEALRDINRHYACERAAERLIISSPSREKCNNHCSLLFLKLLTGVGNITKSFISFLYRAQAPDLETNKGIVFFGGVILNSLIPLPQANLD